ncbi:TetR family transcriptional regulator [Georgenia faecalis]|nr:TetR family transcriptional regulator [Georgenia faecalis]
MMNKRRGRPRSGSEGGRERILSAAGALFVAHGYERTTLRAVAHQAGCDVALIGYHFGSKKGLFAQAMALEIAPTAVLERALPGDPGTLGPRLLAHVTAAWEQPAFAASLSHLVQLAMSDEEVRRPFVEYLDREVMERLVEYFGGVDARARATAVLTLVIGAIFGRYVLRVPGLAEQEVEAYRAALAPGARTAAAPRRHL